MIAAEPGACVLSGTTASIDEGAGAADFFLVVPVSSSGEGSYGVDSGGVRRGTALAPCFAQATINECAP